MADIDFLSNKKAGEIDQTQSNNKQRQRLVWSAPEDKKPLAKEPGFSMLSFFGKKKEIKKAEEPVKKPVKPVEQPTVTAVKPVIVIDKNKIKESRKEILKLIDKHDGLERGARGSSSQAKDRKAEPKDRKKIFDSFFEKFKKQPSHKEILLNYQQVIDQEKNKRNQAAGKDVTPPSPAKPAPPPPPAIVKPAAPVKPPPIKPPLPPIAPPPARQPVAGQTRTKVQAAAKPKPSSGEGIFARLKKFLRELFAAVGKPKLKAVKIPAPAPAKPAPKPDDSIIVQVVKPELARPAEIKIQENPPRPAKAAPADKTAAKVLETNLIKGEIVTFFDWQRKSLVLISAILTPVALIALISLGLVFYQKQSQAKIQDQITKASELKDKIKLAQQDLSQILDFQSRLKLISQIFAKHIYWTNFFKFLEDNTIKDVYYTGFTGDTSGKYSLEAMALKYSDLDKQVDLLRNNQKIYSANTDSGEAVKNREDGQTRIKFKLNFSVFKSIFTEAE